MARRRRKKEAATPEHLTITDSYQYRGRWLRPGTEFSVHGVKGRLRFLRHVANSQTETDWVEARDIDKHFRAFYPDRIKTVHSTVRTRENHDG
jgi:hypothetical protein